MTISEHDQGYLLGLEMSLKLTLETQQSVTDVAITKKEKEAAFRGCEIIHVKLKKEIDMFKARNKQSKG